MVARSNIKDDLNPRDQKDRIKSGLEGQNIPSDFHLPPCGLEDIDRALFNLFDKDIQFVVSNQNQTQRVPVVFATGERFALIKRRDPIRDNNDALILPLISIRRTSIDQSPRSEKLHDTGDLVIKRRLSTRDPIYQNLVNPLNIRHQDNVRSENNELETTKPQGVKPGRVSSRRLANKTASGGPIITNKLDSKHIYEIITIPFPHFIDVSYEVTFWTSYTTHMNEMIERFTGAYTGNRNQFKIESDKGYWFVAYPDDSVSNQDNFDDFTNDERIVRYTFNMKVPGYIVASQNPGDMLPFRKFVSAPDVSFEIFSANAEIVDHPDIHPDPTGDIDKFVLSDVSLLDTAGNEIDNDRKRYLKAKTAVKNPFTGEDEIEYLKVISRNQRQGETVVSARIVTKIDDI